MERTWDDPTFKIECITSGDIAYAVTPDDAVCAYYTLRKECGVQGTRMRVRNLDTGTIIWGD